jgi:carbon-monoxide dehydrogenase small subunit
MKKNSPIAKLITFTVNGKEFTRYVIQSMLLIDLIRDELGLTGTKTGCLEGECGACSVLLNGAAINSCLFLAINVEGHEITTIEGFSTGEKMDEVQTAMIQNGAVQCGFCSSGMAVSIKSMQTRSRNESRIPTRHEIQKGLEGNLCRCTGYIKIIEAAGEILNK